ncbi:TIGR00270 family protein [Candidatus Woesearchaeota archaeon]|nr:TIGR00270 family protein [Candidatus Woesearchaeota archaeon]
MECEMCGKQGKLFVTSLEGTYMNLCATCTKFGKTLKPFQKLSEQTKNQSPLVSRPQFPQEEHVEVIVENYAQLIKEKREKLGLKQEDLAKKLAERVSLIQKLESGTFEPSLALSRKLEKYLEMKLVEQHTESHGIQKRSSSSVLTIGDMLNLKKK